MAGKMFPISLAVLIVGFAGGYVIEHSTMSFVLYHLGGLGAISVLASVTAAIAARKGRGYRRPYLLALVPAIVVGLIAAYLVPPAAGEGRPAACGGSVSLLLGFAALAYWAVVRPKGEQQAGRKEVAS